MPNPLRIELPENSPRYVVLSYELNHSDGRKSFPLVLVNWAPTSSEIGMMTLHASALFDFQAAVCKPKTNMSRFMNFISPFLGRR